MNTFRLIFLCGLLLGAWALSMSCLDAQTEPAAAPEAVYTPPEGSAPPVAPPLKKGSPLDHLTNDPKVESLPVGYQEGDTRGADYFIAHRFIDDMGGQGWGWVKKNGDDWDDAKWIALQETPGLAVAPYRKLVTHDLDVDWEFKFWGRFATYKAYDPHLDEMLPVFILQGYEVIGPAQPLREKVGPRDRIFIHRPSGASSRSNRPILANPDVD